MRIIVPAGIALLGLGTGLAAGLALKPPPEVVAGAETCAPSCPETPADGRLERLSLGSGGRDARPAVYVALDKPFVVPVFEDGRVAAMVVVSVSIEISANRKLEAGIKAVAPRLRDSFLKAMFRHANSNGFGGSFTSGRQMDDLKSALLAAAGEVLGDGRVNEVLITDITRQDL
jgi:hypothetical protein